MCFVKLGFVGLVSCYLLYIGVSVLQLASISRVWTRRWCACSGAALFLPDLSSPSQTFRRFYLLILSNLSSLTASRRVYQYFAGTLTSHAY